MRERERERERGKEGEGGGECMYTYMRMCMCVFYQKGEKEEGGEREIIIQNSMAYHMLLLLIIPSHVPVHSKVGQSL